MTTAFKDWGAIFKAADKDKDGVIDFQQLKSALQTYGYHGNDQEIKDMFHKEEKDVNNIRVSRVEFTKAMNEKPDNFHVSIMFRKASQGKKNLNQDQLQAIIQELDAVMVPEAEVAQLRSCLGKNPGGATVEGFLSSYLNPDKK